MGPGSDGDGPSVTTPPAEERAVPRASGTADGDDVVRGDAAPPPESPGGVDLAFRPDVEGLRAVAVVLVVLYHAGVSSVLGGFVGVDVFFVISGYLITGLLIREHEKRKKISIPGFYARRARRILPAASLVIIASLVLAYHYQNFLTYDQVTADDAKWAAAFAANLHFGFIQTNYFSLGRAPSPFLHFWSLAVEEQFYVVWPSLVIVVGLLFRKWPLRYTVLAVALVASVGSFLYSVHLTDTNLTWAYYSPFSRAWELGVGAMAACLATQAARLHRWVGAALAWGGLAAIAVSATTFSTNTIFPGVAALVPVLGAVAVVVGGGSGIGAGHLLGVPPVRAVGRVSYGWYLLHYPPMIVLIGALPVSAGQLPVHERLEIGAATLALAFIMYYVVERPIRRSKVLARHPWVSIAMGLVLVLAAFLVATWLTKSLTY